MGKTIINELTEASRDTSYHLEIRGKVSGMDLSDKRFGRLVAVDPYCVLGKHYKSKWICVCDCGNEAIIEAHNLLSGRTKSCGCSRYNIRTDPETRKKKRRAYSQTHKAEKAEYDTARYLENREERLKYAAAYNKKHAIKIAQRQAEYYLLHKMELLQHMAKDYKEHPSKYIARAAKRRALKAGALVNATPGQQDEVKEIYKSAREGLKVRCYLCGKLIPMGHRHVDHIIPLSRGGLHLPSNLAVACDKCNLHKSAKLPEEIGLLI